LNNLELRSTKYWYHNLFN